IAFHGNGNWNGDPESRFQIVLEGIDTFEARWQGGSNSGFGYDGDGDLSIEPPACEDFGDAPESYGTTLADDGARHTIVPGLLLGSLIDFDPDGQTSTDADGDDANRLADEDGVEINPDLGLPVGLLVAQAGETNTARVTVVGDGYLSGWIDLNQNGVFDDDEK